MVVKGMEMRITKETDGRGRKEQCSDKKDEDRRLRGGRARTRKTNGERTTENRGESHSRRGGGQWDKRGEKFM